MEYTALSREEVRSVIEGRSISPRIPVILKFWTITSTFGDREAQAKQIISKYPEDVQSIPIRMPQVFKSETSFPGYTWVNYENPDKDKKSGLDQIIAIPDWDNIDSILENFPDPHSPHMLSLSTPPDGRYRLGQFWFCYFERHWQLRGMTNALMDYYTDPEAVHRLFRALTDFYLVMMERSAREAALDGIFTSDDIGMQTGTFFSKEIFKEFFAPYYMELISKAHSLGMHFWLHTCGCIEQFIPDFIEMKLDVIHPIQKYTMDEKKIADAFGKDICIWAGFDVQRTIPWGTAEDVRKEVRFMMDTYYRPEGRLMFTAGNGINGDCPLESLEALYSEAFRYGSEITGRK